jgi:hypothetical protein
MLKIMQLLLTWRKPFTNLIALNILEMLTAGGIPYVIMGVVHIVGYKLWWK